MQSQVQVRALYDFVAAHEQELTFNQGDIIYYVTAVDNTWWSGTTQDGRTGVFPSNYVETIPSSTAISATTPSTTASPAASSSAPATAPSATLPHADVLVRARWDYQGQSESELSLAKGALYKVTDKDSEGVWWQGICTEGGAMGWFPASYVETVPSNPAPAQAPAHAPKTAVPNSAGIGSPTVAYGAQARTIPVAVRGASLEYSPPPSPKPDPPTPHREIKKEKIGRDTFAFVEVHVFECTGISMPKKGSSVQISLKEWGKLRKVFQTAQIKKTETPTWNESFQLNVVDPEDSDLIISVLDGKKTVGELQFPLRASKRTQLEEAGGHESRWPLQGKDASGSLHLIIKYRDVNAISKPADFVKEQSINVSGGSLVTSNLSPEWAKVVQASSLSGTSSSSMPSAPVTPAVPAQQAAYPPPSGQAPSPSPLPATPLAGFKPPPPAGPRPTAPAPTPTQPRQPGFRPPPPAGPRPTPLPGRGPTSAPAATAAPQSVSAPAAASIQPGFRPPPPSVPRPSQPETGFRPPLPPGPRPTHLAARPQPPPPAARPQATIQGAYRAQQQQHPGYAQPTQQYDQYH